MINRCCYCGKRIDGGSETVKTKSICGIVVDLYYCPDHAFRAFIDIGIDGA